MSGYGKRIDNDQLKKYTADQVGEWLCETGFGNHTHIFLARNIDGAKLLDMKEFQLGNFFPGNQNSLQKSEFWSLLQAIQNNTGMSEGRPNSNVFGQRDTRPPYDRPRQASLPDQGLVNFSPQHHQNLRSLKQEPQHYTIDDDFSSDEENYMDGPVTVPSQSPSGHNQQYPGPGGFSARSFPAAGFDRANPPQPNARPRPVTANYTKWNPATKANRPGNPPIGMLGNPPIGKPGNPSIGMFGNPPIGMAGNPPIRPSPYRPPIDVPDSDGGEDYLTFEGQGSTPTHAHPPYHAPQHHRGGPGRPQLPAPVQPSWDPPAPSIPPRSPARLPPNLLEDAISQRRSSHIDDLHPGRPPPQPPRQSQSHFTLPSRPPPTPTFPISRNNSDKSNSPHISPRTSQKDDNRSPNTITRPNNRSIDSSRISPGSSRKEDNMMAFSHLKTRHGNRSTDSSSSASSEELTQKPAGGTFVFANEGRLPTKFVHRPPKERPISSSPMPPLVTSTASAENVEDQHWYRDMTRGQAQSYLEGYKENGHFIVRSRQGHYHEYALTLWANGKFYNFVVKQRSDGAYALGSEKTGEHSFESVVKLIEYHQNNLLVLAEGEGSVKLVPLPQ